MQTRVFGVGSRLWPTNIALLLVAWLSMSMVPSASAQDDSYHPNWIATFNVNLRYPDSGKVDRLLEQLSDPTSTTYHRYLTSQQFIDGYCPSQSSLNQVTNWMKQHGLTVTAVTANRLIVQVRGTEAQLVQVLGVHTSVNRRTDFNVPPELASMVDSIASGCITPVSNVETVKAPDSYPINGLTPQILASIYNYPNSSNPNATTIYSGKERSIAIVAIDSFSPVDVATFWKQLGIKRTGTLQVVGVNGLATNKNLETTLDIEQAGSAAPDANIIVYEGANDSATYPMLFNQAITDNIADVISVSSGIPENAFGIGAMIASDNLFKEAAAQGIAIFAATGDNGAYDDQDPKTNKISPPATTVDFPASDPLVTAVGGTSLTLNMHNARTNEVAWTGSGGGYSIYWKKPSWQEADSQQTHSNMRGCADVALAADPDLGYYACYYQNDWITTGGTSAATPNWAGIWALAEEACGDKRLGDTNQLIYAIGKSKDYHRVFLDITSGANDDQGEGPGYQAGPGWDIPTGWGVPNVTELVNWLKAQMANC